jgi:hypothetical protein
MEGLSTPWYTQRIASAAHQPHPIGPWIHCSTHCGISDPLAVFLSPTRAVLPQTPTPQTRRISTGWALKDCQTCDPQIFTISLCWSAPPGLHRPPWYLLGCTPHACTGLYDLHLNRAPKACQASNPQTHRIFTPGTCSKGPLVCLNKRPLPIGLWDPTYLTPATGGLQTCLRDTHRQVWMLKE